MEQKTRKPRLWEGNYPKGDDWECVEIFETEEGEWHLWAKDQTDTTWRNFKLIANGQALRKANYWLGWNGARGDHHLDWKFLAEGRKELYEMLLDYLKS